MTLTDDEVWVRRVIRLAKGAHDAGNETLASALLDVVRSLVTDWPRLNRPEIGVNIADDGTVWFPDF